MTYDWTPEQLNIFDAVKSKSTDGSPTNPLIKINAVAGASKTTTLVELAKRAVQANPDTTFRYLVFGSANAAEAKLKFGHNAICSTLHALAYHAVVKPYKLLLPITSYISWQSTKYLKIPYNISPIAITIADEFCNSGYIDFNTFSIQHTNEKYTPTNFKYAKLILQGMTNGKIQSTHNFYLKLYHMGIMNGTIVPATTDILAVDEAGDLTQITLDIFDKYPARQKIMVGDSAQAIFSFMGCVSGFNYYHNKGLLLTLSQSFRVSIQIAERIQSFCNRTVDPTMIFRGMEYKNPTITTSAYITRTNSALITKMIQLNKQGKPYRLISKAKASQLFAYPIFLLTAKQGKKQYTQDLKKLQKQVDDHHRYGIKVSKTKYLLEQNPNHPELEAAVTLLSTFTPDEIFNASAQAEIHRQTNCNYVLTTSHSSKG